MSFLPLTYVFSGTANVDVRCMQCDILRQNYSLKKLTKHSSIVSIVILIIILSGKFFSFDYRIDQTKIRLLWRDHIFLKNYIIYCKYTLLQNYLHEVFFMMICLL